ncbi:cytochrome c oxidase assembly protein [Bythopirellula goksoeyrii]|uniref:Cytochrome c oxidase caa3 assembly factor (Caa3_CtaG) n=1 Tax=Bythopirellula goksoeyrii TaxID=1400387 RepID=A0A5B9QE41_9BACT|nr:cytochrome c oxidase assembly protein [Bythopirellula goksoeyrii]QEG37194.1 Cytochrome c oxidase caa3 assembly factor (Caa3_CtaG) [Bythopirellula goksoeyrii]
MMSEKLWYWTSPVWLVVVMLLVGYLILARGRSRTQLAIFLLGLIALTLAFVSPVGVLSDGYLFSAHMVQHLVLLLVVPLCILLSLPKQQMSQWFNRPKFDRFGRLLAIASIGWICGVGAMWFWHVPTLCSTAAQRPAVGLLRDLSLVLAGLAFWWPIYAPCARYRLDPLRGIAYLFSACLGCTLLGIYITFAPLSVCPVFASPVDRIGILNSLYDAGITPGIDQHIGGLMMWVPPCVLYVGAIISLLSRWYSDVEPESPFVPGRAKPSGVTL